MAPAPNHPEMDLSAILVATDFSDCSGAALQMAQNLARCFAARIILLHVIPHSFLANLAEYLQQPEANLLTELRSRAQQQLEEFRQRWVKEGVEVETMVAVGLPFKEIAVIARDLAVDLVVLGGYGRSGRGPIEEVFFGSNAEKVVRLLPCPVLCVPLGGVRGEVARSQ